MLCLPKHRGENVLKNSNLQIQRKTQEEENAKGRQDKSNYQIILIKQTRNNHDQTLKRE